MTSLLDRYSRATTFPRGPSTHDGKTPGTMTVRMDPDATDDKDREEPQRDAPQRWSNTAPGPGANAEQPGHRSPSTMWDAPQSDQPIHHDRETSTPSGGARSARHITALEVGQRVWHELANSAGEIVMDITQEGGMEVYLVLYDNGQRSQPIPHYELVEEAPPAEVEPEPAAEPQPQPEEQEEQRFQRGDRVDLIEDGETVMSNGEVLGENVTGGQYHYRVRWPDGEMMEGPGRMFVPTQQPEAQPQPDLQIGERVRLLVEQVGVVGDVVAVAPPGGGQGGRWITVDWDDGRREGYDERVLERVQPAEPAQPEVTPKEEELPEVMMPPQLEGIVTEEEFREDPERFLSQLAGDVTLGGFRFTAEQPEPQSELAEDFMEDFQSREDPYGWFGQVLNTKQFHEGLSSAADKYPDSIAEMFASLTQQWAVQGKAGSTNPTAYLVQHLTTHDSFQKIAKRFPYKAQLASTMAAIRTGWLDRTEEYLVSQEASSEEEERAYGLSTKHEQQFVEFVRTNPTMFSRAVELIAQGGPQSEQTKQLLAGGVSGIEDIDPIMAAETLMQSAMQVDQHVIGRDYFAPSPQRAYIDLAYPVLVEGVVEADSEEKEQIRAVVAGADPGVPPAYQMANIDWIMEKGVMSDSVKTLLIAQAANVFSQGKEDDVIEWLSGKDNPVWFVKQLNGIGYKVVPNKWIDLVDSRWDEDGLMQPFTGRSDAVMEHIKRIYPRASVGSTVQISRGDVESREYDPELARMLGLPRIQEHVSANLASIADGEFPAIDTEDFISLLQQRVGSLSGEEVSTLKELMLSGLFQKGRNPKRPEGFSTVRSDQIAKWAKKAGLPGLVEAINEQTLTGRVYDKKALLEPNEVMNLITKSANKLPNAVQSWIRDNVTGQVDSTGAKALLEVMESIRQGRPANPPSYVVDGERYPARYPAEFGISQWPFDPGYLTNKDIEDEFTFTMGMTDDTIQSMPQEVADYVFPNPQWNDHIRPSAVQRPFGWIRLQPVRYAEKSEDQEQANLKPTRQAWVVREAQSDALQHRSKQLAKDAWTYSLSDDEKDGLGRNYSVTTSTALISNYNSAKGYLDALEEKIAARDFADVSEADWSQKRDVVFKKLEMIKPLYDKWSKEFSARQDQDVVFQYFMRWSDQAYRGLLRTIYSMPEELRPDEIWIPPTSYFYAKTSGGGADYADVDAVMEEFGVYDENDRLTGERVPKSWNNYSNVARNFFGLEGMTDIPGTVKSDSVWGYSPGIKLNKGYRVDLADVQENQKRLWARLGSFSVQAQSAEEYEHMKEYLEGPQEEVFDVIPELRGPREDQPHPEQGSTGEYDPEITLGQFFSRFSSDAQEQAAQVARDYALDRIAQATKQPSRVTQHILRLIDQADNPVDQVAGYIMALQNTPAYADNDNAHKEVMQAILTRLGVADVGTMEIEAQATEDYEGLLRYLNQPEQQTFDVVPELRGPRETPGIPFEVQERLGSWVSGTLKQLSPDAQVMAVEIAREMADQMRASAAPVPEGYFDEAAVHYEAAGDQPHQAVVSFMWAVVLSDRGGGHDLYDREPIMEALERALQEWSERVQTKLGVADVGRMEIEAQANYEFQIGDNVIIDAEHFKTASTLHILYGLTGVITGLNTAGVYVHTMVPDPPGQLSVREIDILNDVLGLDDAAAGILIAAIHLSLVGEAVEEADPAQQIQQLQEQLYDLQRQPEQDPGQIAEIQQQLSQLRPDTQRFYAGVLDRMRREAQVKFSVGDVVDEMTGLQKTRGTVLDVYPAGTRFLLETYKVRWPNGVTDIHSDAELVASQTQAAQSQAPQDIGFQIGDRVEDAEHPSIGIGTVELVYASGMMADVYFNKPDHPDDEGTYSVRVENLIPYMAPQDPAVQIEQLQEQLYDLQQQPMPDQQQVEDLRSQLDQLRPGTQKFYTAQADQLSFEELLSRMFQPGQQYPAEELVPYTDEPEPEPKRPTQYSPGVMAPDPFNPLHSTAQSAEEYQQIKDYLESPEQQTISPEQQHEMLRPEEQQYYPDEEYDVAHFLEFAPEQVKIGRDLAVEMLDSYAAERGVDSNNIQEMAERSGDYWSGDLFREAWTAVHIGGDDDTMHAWWDIHDAFTAMAYIGDDGTLRGYDANVAGEANQFMERVDAFRDQWWKALKDKLAFAGAEQAELEVQSQSTEDYEGLLRYLNQPEQETLTPEIQQEMLRGPGAEPDPEWPAIEYGNTREVIRFFYHKLDESAQHAAAEIAFEMLQERINQYIDPAVLNEWRAQPLVPSDVQDQESHFAEFYDWLLGAQLLEAHSQMETVETRLDMVDGSVGLSAQIVGPNTLERQAEPQVDAAYAAWWDKVRTKLAFHDAPEGQYERQEQPSITPEGPAYPGQYDPMGVEAQSAESYEELLKNLQEPGQTTVPVEDIRTTEHGIEPRYGEAETWGRFDKVFVGMSPDAAYVALEILRDMTVSIQQQIEAAAQQDDVQQDPAMTDMILESFQRALEAVDGVDSEAVNRSLAAQRSYRAWAAQQLLNASANGLVHIEHRDFWDIKEELYDEWISRVKQRMSFAEGFGYEEGPAYPTRQAYALPLPEPELDPVEVMMAYNAMVASHTVNPMQIPTILADQLNTTPDHISRLLRQVSGMMSIRAQNRVDEVLLDRLYRTGGLNSTSEYGDPPGESVFLCCRLPNHLAGRYESIRDHDNSPRHITLLYVGRFPMKRKDELLNILRAILSDQESIQIRLSGIDWLRNPDDEWVAFTPVQADGLGVLHKKVRTALEAANIKVEHHFRQYRPHVTLQYTGDEKEYDGPTPSGQFTMKDLTVWGLGRQIRIPFGGRSG